MPDEHEPEISKQLRLPRTKVRPVEPRLGGLRAAAAAEARAAANPTIATEPIEIPPVAQAGTAATAAPLASVSKLEVPAPILLIGLYEFVRAVSLSIVFGIMLSDPHSHMFGEGFWTAFYVLSNGALAVTPFLPLTILYALAVGFALWMRARWGRMALMATSCWAVFRLASFLVGYQVFLSNTTDVDIAQISFLRVAAFMLAAVNIGIGAYLAFAPGVAEAFGQKR